MRCQKSLAAVRSNLAGRRDSIDMKSVDGDEENTINNIIFDIVIYGFYN